MAPADAAHVYDPIALLEAGWREIVGNEVAQNSHPTRIADGTLTIITRSSAWSHQLSFLADHVLRAVNARLPGSRRRAAAFPRRAARRAAGRAGPRPDAPSRRRPRPKARPPLRAEALARFRERGRAAAAAAARTRMERVRELRGARRSRTGEALRGLPCSPRHKRSAAATARLLFEAPWLGLCRNGSAR